MNNMTNKTRIFFGIIICILFAFVLGALLFLPIPEANRGITDIMFGSISTIMGMVFTFYFGSSEGSSKKTDAMVNTIKDYNAESEVLEVDSLPVKE